MDKTNNQRGKKNRTRKPTTVTYCIGVDIIGQPIYITHHI